LRNLKTASRKSLPQQETSVSIFGIKCAISQLTYDDTQKCTKVLSQQGTMIVDDAYETTSSMALVLGTVTPTKGQCAVTLDPAGDPPPLRLLGVTKCDGNCWNNRSISAPQSVRLCPVTSLSPSR